MPIDEKNLEKMDLAAAKAEADLENVSEPALREVAAWWKKWYMQAGHKRLAHTLLQYAKK